MTEWPVAANSTTNEWVWANDLSRDGWFVWDADGSVLTYTKWAPGEPLTTSRLDCVVFYAYNNDMWWDGACSDSRQFWCMR